jgi:hypothetical protein
MFASLRELVARYFLVVEPNAESISDCLKIGDSVVGYTPAFMAAAAGSIPVFPTCSFVKSGALYTLYCIEK